MRRLLQLATKDGDIVLDYFAGFSTTAHAVMDLNYDEQTRRKFIMVQLPEKCADTSEAKKAGYPTISALSRERIRRLGNVLKGKQTEALNLQANKLPDVGFKAFSLSSSNFKPWEAAAEKFDDAGKQLDMHVEHLTSASSAEDVLYEILLKAGFPLTTKVDSITLVGNVVFSIDDGALLICLEKEITTELIDALAEANPLQVICLDEGFKGNDQLKANAVQTFKARAQAEESEIVFRTV
jgi:adenine-specific DNA-methyltransferase